MKSHFGFSITGLVTTLVVLGIVSAIAVPKFIEMQNSARHASLAAMRVAIMSSIDIVFTKSAMIGEENLAKGAVLVDNKVISTKYGYPSEESLPNVVAGLNGPDWATTPADRASKSIIWRKKIEPSRPQSHQFNAYTYGLLITLDQYRFMSADDIPKGCFMTYLPATKDMPPHVLLNKDACL